MKKISTLCLVLLSALASWAYDFKSGDLYYNITSDVAPYTVEVTYEESGSDNYSGLTTATIPEAVTYNGTIYSVTRIGDNAFRECSSLTSVTIPNSVTSIEEHAFLTCSLLNCIDIPNGVTRIGNNAFSNCTSLTFIKIPESVVVIENHDDYPSHNNIALNTPNLKSIIVDPNNPVYDSREGCNAVIETATNKLICGCQNTFIPNSVASIGFVAFYGCTTLTFIDIPSTVKSIGENAFYNTGIDSVYIPAETIVEDRKSVIVDLGGAFSSCQNLTNITFAEGIKRIPAGVIAYCLNIRSVHIPSSVTSIGYDAFYWCKSLTSITIPESVTSIEDWAFGGCTSLTSITIPNSVTSIGESAFSYCSSLTSITCEATTPPTLGSTVFPSELTTAYIPCGTKAAYEASDWAQYVGEFVEEDCEETEENDGKYTITYTSTDGKAVTLYKTDGFGANIISNTYDDTRAGVITFDAPVTTIGASAFEGCTTLRSIIIPNSVKSIEEDAFAKCSALRDVSISASVTAISTNPFTDCVNLASITVEEGNPVYDSRNDCNAIIETASNTLLVGCKSTIIPEDVKKIGYSAFYGCINLKAITIPASVELIERAAFHNTGITSITIPANTTLQGGAMVGATIEGVFTECKELESVSIEAGLARIPSAGFCGCTKLSAINIPNTVESIGGMAFFGCSALKSITIPESVTSVEEMAFGGCSSLKTVNVKAFFPPTLGSGTFTSSPTCTIPCGTITLYEASDWNDQVGKFVVGECAEGTQIFYTSTDGNIVTPNRTNGFGANFVSNVYVDGVGIITFDDEITIVGEWSFYGCHSLASITLPETVTKLDRSAFESCTSLESVMLPDGLTTLGDYVFYNNQALKSITIPATVTNMGQHVFEACTALQEIYVEAVTPPALGGSILSGASKPTCYIPCGTLDAYEASAWAGQVAEFVDKCAGGTNIITYTASNDSVVVPHKADAFGAKLISNTYVNGVGTLTFDAPVTKIGNEAFSGCYRLATIDFPVSVETIGSNAFTACTDLQTIDIPNTVTSIQKLAFFGCSSMTDVRLSDHITEINSQTFASCSALKSITIPAEVNKIDARAFKDCIALTQIISEAETPPSLALNVFDNVSTSIPVYVPCGTVEDYKKATRWKKFTKIQEHPAQYKVTLLVNDAEMGTAKIGEKNTFCGTDILAESNEGYHFEKWSDNMTDSVRTLELTSDTTLTAYFGKNLYTISTQPDDATHGVTYGDTTAAYKDIVTISAEANLGWRFVSWNDQITDNPRQVEVIADSLFVALFEEKQLVCDTTYIYTCAHEEFAHPVTGTQILMSDAQQVFTDSVVGANEDTLYVYIAIPVVEPEAMTATILKDIDAVPTLLPGMLPDTDASLAAIRRYYDANDTELIADVLNVEWKTTVVPCDANSHTMTLVVETECDDSEEFSFIFLVEAQTKTITENATACESYTWGRTGANYTVTGVYEHTETSKITGCDSVYYVLNLTINLPASSEIYEEACGSYVWNGQTYTTSGDYTYTTTAQNGCDSTITLHLTIYPSYHVDTAAIACDEFEWYGNTYTASGDYTYTTTTINGCDSIVTLHLTVNKSTIGAPQLDTICYGETFTWNGQDYTATGEYQQILTNAAGCDSLATLQLLVLPQMITQEEKVAVCPSLLPYSWKGQTLTTTGTYTHRMQFVGTTCDSIEHVLAFEVLPIATSETTEVACDSYTWNGKTYTASGDYTFTTTGANGCDSIATLHLTINHSVKTEETAVACDSYAWNGITYSKSGDYTYTTTAQNGCDSTITLHLTINKSVEAEVTEVACDSYTWNGKIYTTSGDYTFTTTAKNGCDSTTTLHLTINRSVNTEEMAEACDSYTWAANGQTYTASGDYTHTLQTIHGCDSTITLHLAINKSVATEQTIEACDSYTWNNITYQRSGDYVQRLTAANGCDSVVTLHLTIHKSVEVVTTETACDSYTWAANGQTYSVSGTYTDTLQTLHGCDSIVVLRLTINKSVETEETAEACDSYTWNGNTYTTSGDYTFTTTAANGCDSTVTLHLTINNSVKTEMTAEACDSYTWNGNTYTTSGDYTFTTTAKNGCDSIVVLRLTVNHSTSGEEAQTICYGETYKWHGTVYNATGDYTYTLTNSVGCDSVATLHLTVMPKMIIDNQNVAICSSDLPYTWYGKQLTSKGTYTHREQFANVDCDSVEHILKLDVLPPTEYLPSDKAMICWGDTYTWAINGKVYDKTGTYTHVVKNFLGCDSLVYSLELTELPAVVNKPVEKQYICWDETYTWHGKTYDKTTTDTYVVENMLGCDSIIYTLNLTELPEMQTKNESISVCPSELPYTWRGQQLTKSGVYTSYVPFVMNADCDSLEYVLDFVVMEETISEKTVTACDSYEWNGKVYTTSGRYTYSTTGANGCDSTAILYLTINRSTYSEEYVTVCYGETYEWNGMEYRQEGDYTVYLTNAAGCDSIAILHLTILPQMKHEYEELTLCPSDLPFLWHGQSLTKPGTYTDREQYTHYDCDRVEYHLTLKVYDFSAPATVTMPRAICGNVVDVIAATEEIEAYIASIPSYAANATIAWQIKKNGTWATLTNEPVKGGLGEITLRYVIYSECGSLPSEEMVVPVEMPTPENDVDMDGISIQSRYNNRIFLFDLNAFNAKFGWKPEPAQVVWYKVVGTVDTYGEKGDDIKVGVGHSYNMPNGAVIEGAYYVLVERMEVTGDECEAAYRSVVISTVVGAQAPKLVPNAVRPSEMMTIKDLDPNQINEIYVYSTTGEMLATYTAEKVREFMLRASNTTGYYIIDVVNNDGKHTLKYIVK